MMMVKADAAFTLEEIYTDSSVLLLKIEIYTNCVYTEHFEFIRIQCESL